MRLEKLPFRQWPLRAEVAPPEPESLSFSSFYEFLSCPSCWSAHREQHKRIPKTADLIEGGFQHLALAEMHKPLGETGLRFRSPATALNFFEKHYPRQLREEGRFAILDLIRLPAYKDWLERFKGQLVVYFFRNERSCLEAKERSYEAVLDDGDSQVQIMAIIDQVRKKVISGGGTPDGKGRKYQRQIVEIKKSVPKKGPSFYVTLQTGFQGLVYQLVEDHQLEPEMWVYDFETADFWQRHGGDETLLAEGIILMSQAMERGYRAINTDHKHFRGGLSAESQMSFMPGFGPSADEVAKIEEAAFLYQEGRQVLKNYVAGCSWQRRVSPYRVEQTQQGLRVWTGVHCGECASEIFRDIGGGRYCPSCGQAG